MSFPLKCRIWRYCHAEKKRKCYYLPHLKIGDYDNTLIFDGEDYPYVDTTISTPEMVKAEVEWCTGLVDKNGNDIYEHDMITYHYFIGEPYNRYEKQSEPVMVTWYNHKAAFGLLTKKMTLLSEVIQPEIVGNIHLNHGKSGHG